MSVVEPDIIDAEIVDEPTVAALVHVPNTGSLVVPAAPEAQIVQAFEAYTRLCSKLLTADDYQRIGDKQFRKKSAWRKLAVAFGVSTEIISRDYERNDRGRIVRAEVVVRATAPNGRSWDGVGACDAFERCCEKNCKKKSWNNHTCCDVDCDGMSHFSKSQHDIPATAATRAGNRACADLFGMGEVSAEEVADAGEVGDWFQSNGWHDQAEHDEFRKLTLAGVTAETRAAWKEFVESSGLWNRPWPKAAAVRIRQEAERLVAENGYSDDDPERPFDA